MKTWQKVLIIVGVLVVIFGLILGALGVFIGQQISKSITETTQKKEEELANVENQISNITDSLNKSLDILTYNNNLATKREALFDSLNDMIFVVDNADTPEEVETAITDYELVVSDMDNYIQSSKIEADSLILKKYNQDFVNTATEIAQKARDYLAVAREGKNFSKEIQALNEQIDILNETNQKLNEVSSKLVVE